MRVAAGFKGGQNNGARKKLANKCTWYYSFDLRLFRGVQKRTHPSSNTALYIINGALPFVRFAMYNILLVALFGALYLNQSTEPHVSGVVLLYIPLLTLEYAR